MISHSTRRARATRLLISKYMDGLSLFRLRGVVVSTPAYESAGQGSNLGQSTRISPSSLTLLFGLVDRVGNVGRQAAGMLVTPALWSVVIISYPPQAQGLQRRI